MRQKQGKPNFLCVCWSTDAGNNSDSDSSGANRVPVVLRLGDSFGFTLF